MTGRPRVFHVTEKTCPKCGTRFGMADVGVKFPSHFSYVRYCSKECRPSKAQNGNGNKRSVATIRRDLLAKLIVTDAGCWEWQGALTRNGYGRTSRNSVNTRVHRLAYELFKGEIPAGALILHNCDNRRCANPHHLRPGTAAENVRDMLTRERGRHQRNAPSRSNQS